MDKSLVSCPSIVRGTLARAKGPRRKPLAPDVAVLVSTFEKPTHLRRVLASLAVQERVAGAIEVVVTDDGSTDDTSRIVHEFARDAPFPVHLTTHPHEGFQLARCRNDGVRASRAPYLLFLDGDCVVPRDHIRQHLDHRRERWVMGGYCCRLDRDTSDRVTESAIRADAYKAWVPRKEFKKLAQRHRKAVLYSLLRHPGKPKLAGGNIGVWRDDYERVNGYDENFVGWGGEDDDLRRRLVATGVRVGSILRYTHTYHLWHPPTPTAAPSYWQGVNVDYLHRAGRLVRCRHGLVERRLSDISMNLVGTPENPAVASRFLSDLAPDVRIRQDDDQAEVEILFLPGKGRFSGTAQCNVLVLSDPTVANAATRVGRWRSVARRPNLILSSAPLNTIPNGARVFPLGDARKLFEAIS